MQAILIPVDGSDCSVRALKFALELAAGRTLALHVLTVQAPVISGNVRRFVSAETIADYYRDEGRRALAPAKEALDAAGVAYQEAMEVGPPAPTIAEFAKTHRCDFIVMGSRGLGAVANLVLGSVAARVLHLTDLPVVLVK